MWNTLTQLSNQVLHRLEPEQAHKVAIQLLRSGMAPSIGARELRGLDCQLADLHFKHPLGLAAGFDKNAEAPIELLKIGFAFVEIGTVTPLPQPGNPKPRVFRLVEDEAVINRLGFNSEGHDTVFERIEKATNKIRMADKGEFGVLGVNIGANKDSEDKIADYVKGIERFDRVADYITINISSPNTPGLRMLQQKQQLTELLEKLNDARNKKQANRIVPLFLKIAPDMGLGQLDMIVKVCKENAIDALIISNTTVSRPPLRSSHRQEEGGLSGRPLFNRATALLAEASIRLEDEIPLIGVGGVTTPKDVLMKIQAGATLVQAYTGLIYKGPPLLTETVDLLSRTLKERKVSSIKKLIGSEKADLANLFKEWEK